MNYVEENKGFYTSSKVKAFLDDPESYKIKFIDQKITGDENLDHFRIGTAFDDFVSYGRDYFEGKYTVLGKRNDMSDPTLFTRSQGRTLDWLFAEAERQPLFNIWSKDYEHQKVIETEWSDIKLKCTLDRVNTKEHIIEDTKTCQNVAYIGSIYKCPIVEYDYILQAAFYCLCYYVDTGHWPKFYWNFFDKGSLQRPYSRFLKIECPMELMKDYLPRKEGKEAHKGLILETVEKIVEAEKNGFNSIRDLVIDDGFGHLKSKYYNVSKGSIQKKPATYQSFCGNNDV